MNLYNRHQVDDIAVVSGIQGWKVAIAISAAVVLAPVIALSLFVFLATAFPFLPVLLTISVTQALRRRERAPDSTAALALAVRPTAHAQ